MNIDKFFCHVNRLSRYSARHFSNVLLCLQVSYKVVAHYFMVFLIPFIILLTLTYNLIKDLEIVQTKKRKMTAKVSSVCHVDAPALKAGHINKTSRPTKPVGAPDRSQRMFENITPAFVCVVVVFLVCQMFNPARRLLMYVVPPEQQKCWSFFSVFSPFCGTAILVNSAGNFFIFVLVAKGFRRQVVSWFR